MLIAAICLTLLSAGGESGLKGLQSAAVLSRYRSPSSSTA
nr:hypothetical protein [Salinicola tamaricis]